MYALVELMKMNWFGPIAEETDVAFDVLDVVGDPIHDGIESPTGQCPLGRGFGRARRDERGHAFDGVSPLSG